MADRVLTVRAIGGLSGDMMVSGLASLAGLTSSDLGVFVAEMGLPALNGCLRLEPRFVNRIAGVGCHIHLPHDHTHRPFKDIRALIDASAMPGDAKVLSADTFALLAEAEAAVHGRDPNDVVFHEVGGLDSILDICLVCRLVTLLKPGRFVCSPLPLADGLIRCAHGLLASPAPAVLRLLEGVPVHDFPGDGETVTPTALALLKTVGVTFGGWPSMVVEHTVISYGTKIFANAPNGALWASGRTL